MPRVDPDIILQDWQEATQGELLPEPPYVLAAREEIERRRQIEAQHWFDMKVDEVQRVIESATQMQLQLPEMNERARVRELTAEYLDRVVLPRTDSPHIHRIPPTLRSVRKRCDRAVLPCGKRLSRWDSKAGIPLLCPDDARDEANRIQRRYVPAIMQAVRDGLYVYSCVFTIDNPAPGKLHAGVRKLHRKLNSLWRACKRAERPLPIVGGISVLEAPLGGYRDWHPHLNVILVCDGWLDYRKARARWGCNVHFEQLSCPHDPGSLTSIKAAVRELIKYAVQAVSAKSLGKAEGTARSHRARARELAGVDEDRPPAPAMTDYTAAEWVEWWNAHRGLRRTRTFGCLFKVPKPEKLDATGALWTHSDVYNGREYVRRFPLLESIPGDISTTLRNPEDIREAIRRLKIDLLGPPDLLDRVREAQRTIEEHYGPVSLAVD